MKIKIAIIGTGYVGLTTGACFAYLGHKVICVDKDKKKIVKLRKGKVPIYEPGLNEILKKHKKNIEFSVNIGNAVKKSDVIFICVGTPPEKDGSINLDQFKEYVRDIAQSLDCYKVVVN